MQQPTKEYCEGKGFTGLCGMSTLPPAQQPKQDNQPLLVTHQVPKQDSTTVKNAHEPKQLDQLLLVTHQEPKQDTTTVKNAQEPISHAAAFGCCMPAASVGPVLWLMRIRNATVQR
mmetsp:Transcript_85168/g.168979  ORF Transcript_85168/g.168979 Transcript_85168/m.168979 type:complete len:116 (-) Transcript_85168:110-457(-)